MRNSYLAIFTSLMLAACLTMGCGDDDGDSGSGGSGAAGSTTSTGGGGTGGDGTGGGGMCVAFGESCTEGTDTCCDAAGQTGECFAFGMGPRCTIPCPPDPMDCPNNGEGCNNQSPPKCKTEE